MRLRLVGRVGRAMLVLHCPALLTGHLVALPVVACGALMVGHLTAPLLLPALLHRHVGADVLHGTVGGGTVVARLGFLALELLVGAALLLIRALVLVTGVTVLVGHLLALLVLHCAALLPRHQLAPRFCRLYIVFLLILPALLAVLLLHVAVLLHRHLPAVLLRHFPALLARHFCALLLRGRPALGLWHLDAGLDILADLVVSGVPSNFVKPKY